MKRYGNLVILMAIIAVGAILRVYNFGFQPIACDEIYTLSISKMSVLSGFMYVLVNDCTPPLFYLFARVAYIAGGFADVAIRVPSIIFGILTIPAIFYLGQECKFNTHSDDRETIGIFAAAITAILYPLIYYSQFARAYMMVVLVSIVFFTVFLHIRNARGYVSIHYYILLGILGAVAVWIHLFAIFPVVATILTLFVTTARRNAMASASVVFLALLLLIPSFISTRETRAIEDFPGVAAMDLPVLIPIEFFNIGLFVLLPLVAFGIYLARNDKVALESLIIIFLSTLAGISVTLVTQVFPRYFLPIAPLLILFASFALSAIVSKTKDWAKPIVIAGFFIILILTQYTALTALYTVTRLTC